MKRHLSTYTFTVLLAVASAASWVAAAPAQPEDLCCAEQFREAGGMRTIDEAPAQRRAGIRMETGHAPQADVGVGACDSELDSRKS